MVTEFIFQKVYHIIMLLIFRAFSDRDDEALSCFFYGMGADASPETKQTYRLSNILCKYLLIVCWLTPFWH